MRATPTHIEIDLNALGHNFKALQKRINKGAKILAVVKSNAYGHGAVPVARTLQGLGADYFGVGTVDEGVLLREAGIKRPILLLLGLFSGKYSELLRYQLTPVIYELSEAEGLNQFLAGRGEKIDIHVKIDTGMTRLGVSVEEAPRFFEELSKLAFLRPIGLLSHLADADVESFSDRQAVAFERARVEFQKHFSHPIILHLSNSLASIDRRFPEYDMVRLGVVLYGAYPVARQKRLVDLKPVMHWKSQLTAVKTVPKGTPVSYGRTFSTGKSTKIGIVPVGYADGYPRLLSNRSSVLIRGSRVPVVGTVCMDLFMVDLGKIPQAKVGDEVVLLGRQGQQEIRAEELAEWAETISYEIFCHVAERVPRQYLNSHRN